MIIQLAVGLLLTACTLYVLARIISLPYELHTDRLWKYGDFAMDQDGPDDGEKEDTNAEEEKKLLKLVSR